MKKIVNLIDKLILPSVESHQRSYKRKEVKIKKEIIKGVTFNIHELKDINLNTYKELGFVSIYFDDYENLMQDLKANKPINPSYQEDVIKKDIMISIYHIESFNKQKWVLLVDMTNSPYIGLRDYWKVSPPLMVLVC
ncbi:hypothetical protein [uncultured Tenacibaculum sp.]|uniref:hypothetical protein n=1 Tax=uncultured Tenacibaculum sp. TaxID=174713 RepID=UPI00260D0B79|nr:hypothetical protein [uncultured Tenacibaculum sp.]